MRLDLNGEKHRDQCFSTFFLPPPNPPIPRMGKDTILEIIMAQKCPTYLQFRRMSNIRSFWHQNSFQAENFKIKSCLLFRICCGIVESESARNDMIEGGEIQVVREKQLNK